MTSLLADITPWEGSVVPGNIDTRYRLGATINPQQKQIIEKAPPVTTQKLEPNQGLGEGNLIKQLVNVLQKTQTTEKMDTALPQYRSL